LDEAGKAILEVNNKAVSYQLLAFGKRVFKLTANS
jgi:hypothetical protein